MKNLKILALLAIISLFLPANPVSAVYNAVQWSNTMRLYFTQVAPVDGGTKGISLDIYKDSFLEYYYLDVASLRLQMRSGSKVYLQSPDRKIFNVPAGYPETECFDGYSRFAYEFNDAGLADFTITLTDGGNCPEVEELVEAEEPTTPVVEQIDVTNLDRITANGLTKSLDQNSRTHFVLGNIVETIEVLSVGGTETKIKLSAPDKELILSAGKEKIVDTDADGWNDLSLTLKSTTGGEAEFMMRMTEPVKIAGINPGDLVKVLGGTTVYYVGANSKLYVFPNEKTYKTWYSDFSLVKTIGSSDLGKFGWGGLVTYRPGVKMVKFSISPDVYVVGRGGVLRKLKDEAMAKEFYGEDWNKKIDDINEAFMFSYSFGSDLTAVGEYNSEEASQLSPTVGVDRGI